MIGRWSLLTPASYWRSFGCNQFRVGELSLRADASVAVWLDLHRLHDAGITTRHIETVHHQRKHRAEEQVLPEEYLPVHGDHQLEHVVQCQTGSDWPAVEKPWLGALRPPFPDTIVAEQDHHKHWKDRVHEKIAVGWDEEPKGDQNQRYDEIEMNLYCTATRTRRKSTAILDVAQHFIDISYCDALTPTASTVKIKITGKDLHRRTQTAILYCFNNMVEIDYTKTNYTMRVQSK